MTTHERELHQLLEEIAILKVEVASLKLRPVTRLDRSFGRLAANPRTRVALVAALLAIPLAAYAATVSVPYSFTNGTIADASEMNANFNVLVNESNSQDSRIAAVETSIAGIQSQLTTNTSNIGSNTSNIGSNTSNIGSNTSGIAVNTSNIGVIQANVSANSSNIGINASDIASNSSGVASNASNIGTNGTNIITNASNIGALSTTFAGVSRAGPLLTFSGMNVQVDSGTGATGGAVNGLGNLIVGYNENSYAATRAGSHNLIVGADHEFASHSGLVSGWHNTISGAFANVVGGVSNTASGVGASVSGGNGNRSIGTYTVVSGGYDNEASGWSSAATGGQSRTVNTSYDYGRRLSTVSSGNTLMAPNTSATLAKTCPAGWHPISGGWDHYQNPTGSFHLADVTAYFDVGTSGGWSVGVWNRSGSWAEAWVRVICQED